MSSFYDNASPPSPSPGSYRSIRSSDEKWDVLEQNANASIQPAVECPEDGSTAGPTKAITKPWAATSTMLKSTNTSSLLGTTDSSGAAAVGARKRTSSSASKGTSDSETDKQTSPSLVDLGRTSQLLDAGYGLSLWRKASSASARFRRGPLGRKKLANLLGMEPPLTPQSRSTAITMGYQTEPPKHTHGTTDIGLSEHPSDGGSGVPLKAKRILGMDDYNVKVPSTKALKPQRESASTVPPTSYGKYYL